MNRWKAMVQSAASMFWKVLPVTVIIGDAVGAPRVLDHQTAVLINRARNRPSLAQMESSDVLECVAGHVSRR